jgi:hypothetical protein
MLSLRSMTGLTRIGFASRGIMYLIIGYLALRTGRTEDGSGALSYLGSGPGKALLVVMALGFFAYAIWRLSEALIDSEGHGADGKGYAVRAGGAVSGIIHVGLGIIALRLGLGNGGGGGGGGGGATQEGAATALSFPGGEVALILVAVGLALTGGYQLVKAMKGDFLRHLDPQAANRDWVKWMGRGGYAARGIVFLVMGWFFFNAGTSSSAQQAGGMGEALGSLPGTLQALVAAGLFLFGLFSFVEARHRQINDPHVLQRLKVTAAGAL